MNQIVPDENVRLEPRCYADAGFIRDWQVNYIRAHYLASPQEIRDATNKAIEKGEIKLIPKQ